MLIFSVALIFNIVTNIIIKDSLKDGYNCGKKFLVFSIFIFISSYYYNTIGLNLIFILKMISFSILLFISFIDIKYLLVSDLNLILLTICEIIILLLYYFNGDSLDILNKIRGLLLGSLVFLGIYIFTKGGIGQGDIILVSILSFILGLKKTMIMILLSFIISGFFGIFLIIFKEKNSKTKLAFCPFIVLSYYLAIIFEDAFTLFPYNLI